MCLNIIPQRLVPVRVRRFLYHKSGFLLWYFCPVRINQHHTITLIYIIRPKTLQWGFQMIPDYGCGISVPLIQMKFGRQHDPAAERLHGLPCKTFIIPRAIAFFNNLIINITNLRIRPRLWIPFFSFDLSLSSRNTTFNTLTFLPNWDAHDFAKVSVAFHATQNRRSERQKQKVFVVHYRWKND